MVERATSLVHYTTFSSLVLIGIKKLLITKRKQISWFFTTFEIKHLLIKIVTTDFWYFSVIFLYEEHRIEIFVSTLISALKEKYLRINC